MKVPKAPAPPPSAGGEHDTTWTRRNVKGAAGGLEGVDYQTDRRLDAALQGAEEAVHGGPKAPKPGREPRVEDRAPIIAEKHEATPLGIGRDPAQLVLEDDEVASKDPKKRKQRRHLARDRLSIDKDAPDLMRRRRWSEDDEPDDEAPRPDRDSADRDLDLDLDALGDEIARRDPAPSRAHLFRRDERPEPGDPALVDPDEIQRALESPLAYAKHVMILSEAFRRSTGATRSESIEYLARMFVAPSDRSFGRLALKEFGPASGIIDVYPLEVIAHVLSKYPWFLTKAGFGRLFKNVPSGEARALFTDTKTPLFLEYPPELKIRGFAVAGGGQPGYRFEPDDEPGRYRLHIQTAGQFELLVSALNRFGFTTIDRLQIIVRPRTAKDLAAMHPETPYYPERDEERVAAWPIPAAPSVDYRDLLDEDDTGSRPRAKGMMSSGEIVSRQQFDALSGPRPSGDRQVNERGMSGLEASIGRELTLEDTELLRDAVERVLDYAELLAGDTDQEAPLDLDADFGAEEETLPPEDEGLPEENALLDLEGETLEPDEDALRDGEDLGRSDEAEPAPADAGGGADDGDGDGDGDGDDGDGDDDVDDDGDGEQTDVTPVHPRK